LEEAYLPKKRPNSESASYHGIRLLKRLVIRRGRDREGKRYWKELKKKRGVYMTFEKALYTQKRRTTKKKR